MFEGEVNHDAMARLTLKCFACRNGLEGAAFSFHAHIALDVDRLSDEALNRLGGMDVEISQYQMPRRAVASAGEQLG